MSGAIDDMPVRVCECGATWIEDDQMYEEVDRCPGCGRRGDLRFANADLRLEFET